MVGPRISEQDAGEFSAAVARLAKAGLSLDAGLWALAEDLPPGRLRRTLREVSLRLKSGMPLDEAFEPKGEALPAHLRGLILASAKTSRLGEALEQFAECQRKRSELTRRIATSVAYPALLLCLLFGTFALFEELVVPRLADLFEDFEIQLPAITVAAISLRGAGVLLPVFCVGVPLVAWCLVRLIWGAVACSRMAAALPLFGPFWRWSSLAEFTRLLGLLLEHQVALPAALEWTAGGMRDAWLAQACRGIAIDVQSGQPFSAGVDRRRHFPAALVPILQWGERLQSLPQALAAAAELCEARARGQTGLIELVLPPITFLLIIGGTGFLILSMYLPLIKFIQVLT